MKIQVKVSTRHGVLVHREVIVQGTGTDHQHLETVQEAEIEDEVEITTETCKSKQSRTRGEISL